MNLNDSKYTHRKLADGSYNSICLKCFRTVGTSANEVALAENEARHICSPDVWFPQLKREEQATKCGLVLSPF